MKRIIITPAQLRMINEAVAMFTYDDSSQNSFLQSLNRAKENNPGANVFHGYNASETPKQQTSTDDPDQASTAGEYIGNGDNENSTTNTISESRYTKRQVELGRMLEMRKTGKIYSKKQLNEMFEKDNELMQGFENIVRNAYLHEVFEAVATEFGTDAEEKLKEEIYNGEGFMESLRDIFESADDEAKRNFLEKLSTKK